MIGGATSWTAWPRGRAFVLQALVLMSAFALAVCTEPIVAFPAMLVVVLVGRSEPSIAETKPSRISTPLIGPSRYDVSAVGVSRARSSDVRSLQELIAR